MGFFCSANRHAAMHSLYFPDWYSCSAVCTVFFGGIDGRTGRMLGFRALADGQAQVGNRGTNSFACEQRQLLAALSGASVYSNMRSSLGLQRPNHGRSVEQLKNGVRLLVGLREHGGACILQNLGAGQIGRGLGVIGVHQLTFGRAEVH